MPPEMEENSCMAPKRLLSIECVGGILPPVEKGGKS